MNQQFICIPYPPTVNTYWRRVGARVLISKRGREFAKAVADCVLTQRIKRMDGDLDMTIKLYPPDLRKRDVDNTAKAILDSLAKAGVMDDDSQVKRLTIEMMDKYPVGRADVTISEYKRSG